MGIKPKTISSPPSQKFLHIIFLGGILAWLNCLRYKLYFPWPICTVVFVVLGLICRFPHRRSLYEIIVPRLRLILLRVTGQHHLRDISRGDIPVPDLYARFSISIKVQPVSVSDVLNSEVCELLVQYLHRFGLEAALLSIEFDRSEKDWKLLVHYSYNIVTNYRIIMTKHSDHPIYSTGIAQMQRLQNELQAISFASEVIKYSFLGPDSHISERWSHILNNTNEKSATYIIRHKFLRRQHNADFLHTVDACFNDPYTKRIMLHCHSNSAHSLKILGIVTIQQKSYRWDSRRNLRKVKDSIRGGYGDIPGLRLCSGEQLKALYSYNPGYILTELSTDHRDDISISYAIQSDESNSLEQEGKPTASHLSHMENP